MKINKFTKQKNGMYNILLENNTTILAHENLILKYELLIKKEITAEEEKLISKENILYETYDLAIKYITKKMRCTKEIINYLESKTIDQQIIFKVIEMLKKNGYINDDIYVTSFINDKLLLSNDGPNKIKKNLLEQGITNQIIDEKLLVYNKEIQKERIEKIINKMKKTNKNKSVYVLKNKIIDYLSNLGYEKQNILEVLNKFEFENSQELIKKEYDKVYKKLSKKYQGKELEYKIKQKMYSLGFSDFYAE